MHLIHFPLSIFCFIHSVFCFIFCFIHFIHSDLIVSLKGCSDKIFRLAFDKINAKTSDSSKKCILGVTGAYMLSTPLLSLSISLHSQCVPENSLVTQTLLNVLQCPFVEILIYRRILCIKDDPRLCMAFQYQILAAWLQNVL